MTTLGQFGETWAVGLLQRRGYTLVERNVRYRQGEIDIVARDGDWLVFVQVKARRSEAFGTPESSLTPRRFARLSAAIERYVQERGLEDQTYRVDVVALVIDRAGRVAQHRILTHVEAPV